MEWPTGGSAYAVTPYQPYYQEEGSDEGEGSLYLDEQEHVEEEDEQAPQVTKQNFKDLLQQYDHMLVAQGVLPAFMLESQQGALPAAEQGDAYQSDEGTKNAIFSRPVRSLDVAPPHAIQRCHTRAEYSDLEEEEAGGEEQEEEDDAEGEALQDEAESSQVLQQQRRELAMDALGAWVSTFQPRTLSQKKRNARRSGQPGAPPSHRLLHHSSSCTQQYSRSCAFPHYRAAGSAALSRGGAQDPLLALEHRERCIVRVHVWLDLFVGKSSARLVIMRESIAERMHLRR
jgi:hypothetical protein